jgi:hypothetical protein
MDAYLTAALTLASRARAWPCMGPGKFTALFKASKAARWLAGYPLFVGIGQEVEGLALERRIAVQEMCRRASIHQSPASTSWSFRPLIRPAYPSVRCADAQFVVLVLFERRIVNAIGFLEPLRRSQGLSARRPAPFRGRVGQVECIDQAHGVERPYIVGVRGDDFVAVLHRLVQVPLPLIRLKVQGVDLSRVVLLHLRIGFEECVELLNLFAGSVTRGRTWKNAHTA